MKWENLIKQVCPYCENSLVDREGEMRCVACIFHIEYVRYHAISKHRTTVNEHTPKMKWQNVVDSLCPICGLKLRDIEGKQGMMRCVDAHCTFKISNDMLHAILQDPNHPANRYYAIEKSINQNTL